MRDLESLSLVGDTGYESLPEGLELQTEQPNLLILPPPSKLGRAQSHGH